MQATCFAFSYGRHTATRARLKQLGWNYSKLPRFERECTHPDLSGPFPFAKGPLVGFSRQVVSTLVSLREFDEDERHALSTRKRHPLRNVVSGKMYEATHPFHPRRAVIYDDIYYGYLVLRAYANATIALVHARLSEVDKKHPLRLDPQGGLVRIYHKLKTAERFGWVNRSDVLRRSIRSRVRKVLTCTRRWSEVIPGRGWDVAGLDDFKDGIVQWGVRSRARLSANSSRHSQQAVDGQARDVTTCCRHWKFCR
jgi:hypothetical protein